MNVTVFILSLFTLQIICFWVGKNAAKDMTTQKDYFLAGKSIGFFPLMMTFIATQIGGGLILGSAEEAYHYGWYVLLYPLGQCLGFILLAAGIGKRMARFGVSTVAQVFQVVYKSSNLKKIASLLSIGSLFLIFVAQIIASKKFMVSLGIDNMSLFLGFWTIVIIYTVMGGLQAVVATDLIQALFFITIFVLCFVIAFISNPLKIEEIVAAGFQAESFDFNPAKLCGWLLMPLLFMVIEQDMAQRCFAAKSGRVVSYAAGFAALSTFIVCVIPVCFGVIGKTTGILSGDGSSVLMTFIQQNTNPIITALVGCAILAAIISTADSLINAISSNLTQDFDFAFLKQSSSLKVSQFITCLIALGGICVSFLFNNVVDLLIQSYELSVSCLFIPVITAVINQTGNRLSAWLAIIFGACGFIFLRLYPTDFPREILAVGCSLMGFVVGEIAAAALAGQKIITEE